MTNEIVTPTLADNDVYSENPYLNEYYKWVVAGDDEPEPDRSDAPARSLGRAQ